MPKHVQGPKTFRINLTNRSAGFNIRIDDQSELKEL